MEMDDEIYNVHDEFQPFGEPVSTLQEYNSNLRDQFVEIEVPQNEGSQREDVYSTTIKHLQFAVRLQIELEAAKADLARWKTLQLSEQYLRAVPATRRMLDEKRCEYTHKVLKIESKLKATIGILAGMPSFAEHLGTLSNEIDLEEIVGYSVELKRWIQSLNLRRLSAKAKAGAPSPDAHSDDPMCWTWEEINASLEALDELYAEIVENLYTNLDCFSSEEVDIDCMALVTETREKKERAQLLSEASRVAHLLGGASEIGQVLQALVGRANELTVLDNSEKENTARLREEVKEIESRRDEMRSCLARLEQSQREEDARIDELTKKFQELMALPQPRVAPPGELFLQVAGELITQTIKEIEEITKANLFNACTKNMDDRWKLISTKVQAVSNLMESILDRAGRREP